MTVEWHISEDENIPLPRPAEDKPPRSRPGRFWLLMAAVVILSASGFAAGRLWRARQNEALLRTELGDVVRAESQAQAFGLFDEAGELAAPSAPIGWRMAYAKLFFTEADQPEAWRSAYPTLSTWRPPAMAPSTEVLSLDESGSHALVEVVWRGRSEIRETRAYELEGGEWRRVPWLVVDGEPEVVESTHYRLRAHTEDLALAEGGAALLDPLEALYARMDATWAPEYLTQEGTLTVTIEPRELYTLLIRNRPDEITLNSLRTGLGDASLPFSAEKQQLVLLCSLAATYRVNRLPLRATMGYPPDDGMTYNVMYHLLPQAEAYHLLLDEAEALALRNLWRETLAGEWFNPFESPKRPELLRGPEAGRIYREWLLSSRLLIEYLYVAHGVTPGMVVTEVSRAPQRPLVEHVAALSGLPAGEVEMRVKEFASLTE